MKLYRVQTPDAGSIEISGGPGDVAAFIENYPLPDDGDGDLPPKGKGANKGKGAAGKRRGKTNIVPQIAKLKRAGDYVDFPDGFTVTYLGKVDNGKESDDQEETPEKPQNGDG